MSRAVIFDIDGTLVDSVDLHAKAWQEAFRHFGVEVAFPDMRSQIGKGGDQLIPVFLSEEQRTAFGKDLEEFRGRLYQQDYMPRAKPFPKVRDLFARLRELGVPRALASSAKGEEVEYYVGLLGVGDLLDATTSKSDVERSKPCPDVFLAALDRLRLPPSREVVVIGDSPYDIEAALNAGLSAVGVLCGGFPESDLRAAGARAIYRDPADLLGKTGDPPFFQS